jgi:hypothetical protein
MLTFKLMSSCPATPCIIAAYFAYSLYFAYFNHSSRQVQEGRRGSKGNTSDWYRLQHLYRSYFLVLPILEREAGDPGVE